MVYLLKKRREMSQERQKAMEEERERGERVKREEQSPQWGSLSFDGARACSGFSMFLWFASGAQMIISFLHSFSMTSGRLSFFSLHIGGFTVLQ